MYKDNWYTSIITLIKCNFNSENIKTTPQADGLIMTGRQTTCMKNPKYHSILSIAKSRVQYNGNYLRHNKTIYTSHPSEML